ncbi:MAG TPA: GGDEF domain-containing protein [Thermoanaerobaculia bacterium]|nr:GGDEF domain-containing protein [Thermoanaerobaculia bacterium]
MDPDLVREYHAELRDTCRAGVLLIGTLILTIYPLWAWVDLRLEPEIAPSFLAVRAITLLPIFLLYIWVLFRPPSGRICMWIGWVSLTAVEVSVAWMIPQLKQSLGIYLLGFTLIMVGGAGLLQWQRSMIVSFFAVSFTALALFFALASYQWTESAGLFLAFHLVSGLSISVTTWMHRYSVGLADFKTRDALIRETKRADDLALEMSRLSRVDALTGLANRRLWDEATAQIFAVTRRGNMTLAVIMIDIDYFKKINDGFGHAAGDCALKAVADLIARRSRSADIAARLGGDELAILCPASGLEGAMGFAENLRVMASDLVIDEFPGLRLTLSIGVAVARDGDDKDIADLMKRADAQLYEAKRTRNAVCGE